MSFHHIPVLAEQCIDGLNIRPGRIYIDATAGGGGHSLLIAERLSDGGHLYAFDRDPDAAAAAAQRLSGYPADVLHRNYSELKDALAPLGVYGADGILMDLGVSSHQLDTAQRGFSYHTDAPLDMRMSRSGKSAKDVINEYSEQELSKLIFEYGEEKQAKKIAANIIRARADKPIETTLELAEIIKSSVPAAYRREKNPCKKTFQAVRIEVNGEFEHLSKGLDAAFDMLNSGGRLAVITFHSLEDRLVKQRFASYCAGCVCPPGFPTCVCGKFPRALKITRKPIEADAGELNANKRSRSAKLRIIEKI